MPSRGKNAEIQALKKIKNTYNVPLPQEYIV